MKKLLHTPGPWNFTQSIDGWEWIIRRGIFVGNEGVAKTKNESDALLISSAPEMLEFIIEDILSLKIPYRIFGTKNYVERAIEYCMTNENSKAWRIVLKKIQIIEKATGMTIDEVISEN